MVGFSESLGMLPHRGMVQVAQSYGAGNFEANAVRFGWTDKPERQEALLAALRDLLYLDKSALVVRYDLDRGFGVGRRVDIWWGGLERNGALMLLLAYLLHSHDRWREADVRILTVVPSERQKARAEEELAGIMSQTRLAAETRVMVRRPATRRRDPMPKRRSPGARQASRRARRSGPAETAGWHPACYQDRHRDPCVRMKTEPSPGPAGAAYVKGILRKEFEE